MKISKTLDNLITETLLAENAKRESEHTSSGKLSAGMLGKPLQVQVLKSIGVPKKPIDGYTLRKFRRGEHCEQWVLSQFPSVEKQKFVEYRNVVGYVDAIVNTKEWDFDAGIIPIEVKSVANAKYKRITQRGTPDRSHLLQGALYALALNMAEFGLIYIASDDYRVHTSIHRTEDYKAEIDAIIERYDAQMAKKEIPPFELPTKEDVWMSNPKYADYPDFIPLAGAEALALAKKVAGENYKW